jgi:trk system potassium uptake protein TrkA
MKIIILGAGQVGSNLAEHLVREGNDLTVVDLDAEKLADLQDRFDLRTVCGQASHPAILKAGRRRRRRHAGGGHAERRNQHGRLQAGRHPVQHPDQDRAHPRHRLHEVPATVRAENFGVDHVIAPEQEITDYLRKLIDYPEALQVVDFGGGRARLVAMKARAGGPAGRP